jgi:hypothetical protein
MYKSTSSETAPISSIVKIQEFKFLPNVSTQITGHHNPEKRNLEFVGIIYMKVGSHCVKYLATPVATVLPFVSIDLPHMNYDKQRQPAYEHIH